MPEAEARETAGIKLLNSGGENKNIMVKPLRLIFSTVILMKPIRAALPLPTWRPPAKKI